MFFVDNNT